MKGHSRESVSRPAICPDDRHGLLWYRHWHIHWREARGAAAPKYLPLNNLACPFVHHVVPKQRHRAYVARVSFEKWKKTQFTYRGGNPYVSLGQRMAKRYGWHLSPEWDALYELWDNESGWKPWARNSSSGACGIPQQYPCHLSGDAASQIAWGLVYILSTYGSPTHALAVWNSRGWY